MRVLAVTIVHNLSCNTTFEVNADDFAVVSTYIANAVNSKFFIMRVRFSNADDILHYGFTALCKRNLIGRIFVGSTSLLPFLAREK